MLSILRFFRTLMLVFLPLKIMFQAFSEIWMIFWDQRSPGQEIAAYQSKKSTIAQKAPRLNESELQALLK